MPALLCIRQPSAGHGRGDVLQVWAIDHVFRPGETKAAWIADGRDPADWKDVFFVIYVPVTDEVTALARWRDTLTERDMSEINVTDILAPGGIRIVRKEIKRRKRFLAVDMMPLTARNTIRDTGELTITPTQVKQLFRHRDTGDIVDLGI